MLLVCCVGFVCDGTFANWLGDFGEWAFDAICVIGSNATVDDDDEFIDATKHCGFPSEVEDECNELTLVN